MSDESSNTINAAGLPDSAGLRPPPPPMVQTDPQPPTTWYPAPARRRRSRKWLLWVPLVTACLVGLLALWPAPSIWSGPSKVGTESGGLQALSCSTATSCLTFDFRGQTFLLKGRSWHRGAALFPANDLETPSAVSCANPTFCVATGDLGHVVVVQGSKVESILLSNAASVTSVSCPTTTFCMAVGDDGGGPWEWNGATWQVRHPLPGEFINSNTVSCASSRFCAVGRSSGDVATFDGTRWRVDALPATTNGDVRQLSCPTSAYCMGIVSDGSWVSFNGKVWRLHGNFEGDQNLGYTPTMLSCPAVGKCIAASTDNAIYRYENGSWHGLGYLFRQSTLSRLVGRVLPTAAVSVSCPTTRVCFAVDGSGNAYFGRPF